MENPSPAVRVTALPCRAPNAYRSTPHASHVTDDAVILARSGTKHWLNKYPLFFGQVKRPTIAICRDAQSIPTMRHIRRFGYSLGLFGCTENRLWRGTQGAPAPKNTFPQKLTGS